MPPLWDAIARERASRGTARKTRVRRRRPKAKRKASRRAEKAKRRPPRPAPDRGVRADRWASALASDWVFWPACLTGMALLALGILGPDAARRIEMEGRCLAMEAEVESLEKAEAELKAERHALRTDPAYTERVIRSELGIVRPGETPLPLPREIGRQEPPEPAPAATELARARELLEPWNRPPVRLTTLLSGGLLLAAALLLSVPNRPAPNSA